MTSHEARKELQSYRKYITIREQRALRVEELRALLYRCPLPKYGREARAPWPYRREELIDKIGRAERQYVSAIEKSVELLALIEGKVEQLEGRHYEVLRKKYIEGRSYEQIAVDMNYCYEHIRRLEGEGVNLYAMIG